MVLASKVDLKIEKIRITKFNGAKLDAKFGSTTCPTFTETADSTRLCNTTLI